MKCPSCKNPLREKGAGGMTLDVCYGGCGGIWFDATELERVSARAATAAHDLECSGQRGQGDRTALVPALPRTSAGTQMVFGFEAGRD